MTPIGLLGRSLSASKMHGACRLVRSLLQFHGAANADVNIAGRTVEVLLVLVQYIVARGGEAVSQRRVAVDQHAKRRQHLAAIAHLPLHVSLSVWLVCEWAVVAADRIFTFLVPLNCVHLHQRAHFAQIKSVRRTMVKVFVFVEGSLLAFVASRHADVLVLRGNARHELHLAAFSAPGRWDGGICNVPSGSYRLLVAEEDLFIPVLLRGGSARILLWCRALPAKAHRQNNDFIIRFLELPLEYLNAIVRVKVGALRVVGVARHFTIQAFNLEHLALNIAVVLHVLRLDAEATSLRAFLHTGASFVLGLRLVAQSILVFGH